MFYSKIKKKGQKVRNLVEFLTISESSDFAPVYL